MIFYIFIQTLILSVAAGFIIYGEYQSNDYILKRKHDLFIGIGEAIVLIFIVDVVAFSVFKCFIHYHY